MKIGFSILSHKEPDLVFTKLMQQLNTYPDKEIVIHHDFSKSAFDIIKAGNTAFDLIEDSIHTNWSHVNNIDAIFKTFEKLYAKDCDWFITLSANCYPIKSYTHVIDFLRNSSCDGYIERNNIQSDFFDFYQYFRKAFQTRYLFSIPFLKRNGTFYMKAIRRKRDRDQLLFNDSTIPYHGSDWFMINRKSMTYLMENKNKVKEIQHFLKDVNKGPDLNVCPPEVVFQTILGNNQDLKLNMNNYRYIDWTNSINWHPNILQTKDYDAIRTSDALFARKFDANDSMQLIHLINENILLE